MYKTLATRINKLAEESRKQHKFAQVDDPRIFTCGLIIDVTAEYVEFGPVTYEIVKTGPVGKIPAQVEPLPQGKIITLQSVVSAFLIPAFRLASGRAIALTQDELKSMFP